MHKLVICVTALSFLFACKNSAASHSSKDNDSLRSVKDSTAEADTLHYTVAHADEYFVKPPIHLSQYLMTFVPENYEILDTASGDLNQDSFQDLILILRKPHEDTAAMEDTSFRRPLLILAGQPNDSFSLVGRNDQIVLCERCGGAGGDSYQETVIKKGYFSVECGGNTPKAWTRIVTFRYSPADSTWFLHKDGRSDQILTEKNFGKLSFIQFNIYNDTEKK